MKGSFPHPEVRSGNGLKEALPRRTDQLQGAYLTMYRARLIDEKAIILYKQNKAHFQIGVAGHEAVQVAAADCLRPGFDWAYPYYRDTAFCTALGMSNREFFLNVLNKAEDPNSGGRQMPMHFGHVGLNIVSQSSPTGTQFLQSVGAAMAVKFLGGEEVVYVSAGDGTSAQGSYHEMLNWAAREKLPLIILIQDNHYAISVHISEQIAGESVAGISSGYEGMDVLSVNGLDYLESFLALEQAVERARAGEGPTVVVARTVRLQSHSISDDQAKYRTAEEIAEDRAQDPIPALRKMLIEKGISTEAELSKLELQIRAEIDEAAQWANSRPDPEPETCCEHVLVNPNPSAGVVEAEPSAEVLFMVDALNRALDEEMQKDEKVLIFGQDVAHGKGGVFSVTSGLTDKYGTNRVFNSPLAEASIAGAAVGLSTLGFKPVAEIQFGDYIWTGLMQLRNELPMMNYRSNGAFTCPAVIRVAVGGYIHGALYHSQNIEATFAHFPGLIVIYPSNATDAKGLLKSAIRSPDPVLFLEHKGLYRHLAAKGKTGVSEDVTTNWKRENPAKWQARNSHHLGGLGSQIAESSR